MSKRPREALALLLEILKGDPFSTPRSVRSVLKLNPPVDVGRCTCTVLSDVKRLSRKQLSITLSATGGAPL